ncbi:hypothetical protein MRX96_008232 [Rhipicephalus microplus]
MSFSLIGMRERAPRPIRCRAAREYGRFPADPWMDEEDSRVLISWLRDYKSTRRRLAKTSASRTFFRATFIRHAQPDRGGDRPSPLSTEELSISRTAPRNKQSPCSPSVADGLLGSLNSSTSGGAAAWRAGAVARRAYSRERHVRAPGADALTWPAAALVCSTLLTCPQAGPDVESRSL